MNEEIKKEEGAAVGRRQSEGKQAPREVKYPRKQTGIRILATLFFGIVVWAILEIIMFLVVILQILYALIAERPNSWMIGFANQAIAYFYRVMRYLTFNEDRMPFPFSRFPEELEKSGS